MLSYHEVISQLVLITDHKKGVVSAPFEVTLLSKLAYLAPP
jgi:hypothetical protein